MRTTIATIFVIFFVRCEYLRAEPKPGWREDMGDFFRSDSCIFGPKWVSMFLYNSLSKAKVISSEEKICNNIDPLKPIAFLVHGFVSSGNTTSMQKLATQLTQIGYTVFAMDWSQGACTDGIPIVKFMAYPSAVMNTREIGHLIASRIISLVENCGVSLENILLVGHSLGGHVSGFAAKEIQNTTNGVMPIIIAADPATPLFGINNCENRLCITDAKKLIVLHTSPLGISYPLGHLNLKFNNGIMQPECGVNIACSHTRSIDYIADMVGDCGFPGVPVIKKKIQLPFQSSPPYPGSNTTNCIFLNRNILNSDNPMKGEYYVFVEDKNPYCTTKTFSNCEQ